MDTHTNDTPAMSATARRVATTRALHLAAAVVVALLSACGEADLAVGGKQPALVVADVQGDAVLPGDAAASQSDVSSADSATAQAPPDAAPSPDGDGGDAALTAKVIAQRPYGAQVPKQYDTKQSWPLVVALHGYAESGKFLDAYLGLSTQVDKQGFLYAFPNGLVDKTGLRYWNASKACCDMYGSKVDDVAYIRAVIDDMAAKYQVDAKRVYLIGHSNGGFLAHRLACDLSDRVAAVISIAGAGPDAAAKCQPAAKVAVLQIHGTFDAVIPYGGGINLGQAFPGAEATMLAWAKRNVCSASAVTADPMDLDVIVAGKETQVRRWTGCVGGAAELWQVHGASHFPKFPGSFAATAWQWLAAHSKSL